MKQVEASALSRSTTSTNANGAVHKALIQGRYSTIDKVFPMMDMIIQDVRIPNILLWIVTIFMNFQFAIVSLWPYSIFYNLDHRHVAALSQVAWFYRYDIYYKAISITFIVYLVISLLSIAFLIGMIFYYKVNQKFVHWTLVVAKIIIGFIAPILAIPTAVFTGAAFHLYITTYQGLVILFIIVGVIMSIFYYLTTIMGYILQSRSVILDISSYSAFDPTALTYEILIHMVAVFVHFVFINFPFFAQIILQVLHAICLGYVVHRMLKFSFHRTWTSAFCLAIVLGDILMDFFLIGVSFDHDRSPKFVPFVMLLIFVVFVFIILLIIIRNYERRIIRLLNKVKDAEELDDDGKMELFLSKNLDKDSEKTITYFRVGFKYHCDYFIDWSLFRFIVRTFSESHVYCDLIQILAFFPGEYRKLNQLFTVVTQKNELGYGDRFLIYQVYRVNAIRQSSSLTGVNDRLSDLKAQSANFEHLMKSFWVKKSFSGGDLIYVGIKTKQLRVQWENAIREYPNHSKLSEEFMRFETEIDGDLSQAILQHHRAELIDSGKNFAVDKVFRSMVHAFPSYLKKGKIDLHGNIVTSKTTKSNGSSHSSTNNSSLSSALGIDVELEESLSRQIFVSSKMRMALHNALKGRNISSIRVMPYCVFWMTLFYVVAMIMMYFLLSSDYYSIDESMNQILNYGQARLFLALGSSSLLLKVLKNKNRLKNIGIINEYESVDGFESPFLKLDEDFSEQTMKWSTQSRNFFSLLMNELANLAINGVDVYPIASLLLNTSSKLAICDDGGKMMIPTYPSNLKNILLYSYFLQGQMAASTDYAGWFGSANLCELTANWNQVMTGSTVVLQSITDYQVGNFARKNKIYGIIFNILPVLSILIGYGPSLVVCGFYFKQVKKLCNAMANLPSSVKQESMKPILKNLDYDENEVISTTKLPRSFYNFAILTILNLAIAMFFFGILYNNYKMGEDLITLCQWDYLSSLRASVTCEVFYITMLIPAIIYPTDGFSVLSSAAMISITQTVGKQLDSINRDLLQGSESNPPCYGYDAKLDSINFDSSCSIDQSSTNIHDTYRCGSASQEITSFLDFSSQIISLAGTFNGEISSNITLNFLHLSSGHLFTKLIDSLERIRDISLEKLAKVQQNMMIMMIAAIVMSFLAILIALVVFANAKNSLKVAYSLVKHIPPHDLVNDPTILNLILNRNVVVKEQGMCITQSVIHNSKDAVIGTGLSGIIEVVNPAVTEILGYKPEQLLGQPPSAFFKEEDAEKITSQMNLMRNNQSSPVYEDHFVCFSDASGEVPCHTYVLAMTVNDQVSSFIIILRDETALVRQQEDAESAKAQSENLLFHILPRDIVIRLNRGEKDISFTVPTASIIFIDVQRFSEYAANLTPQEIMGNLSLLFASFDAMANKYPLITKIKLIGDIYMAAAGLFTPDDPPRNHAEQILKFGLDCLAELDDINVKLNANLAVRIGVNSGGPILAGVLGTDKPVFDIIGDPINVAARLQTSGTAGRIQIPQSTYDLISGSDFTTERRGEVFLKGKGQTMTYYILNSSPFVQTFSTMELPQFPSLT